MSTNLTTGIIPFTELFERLMTMAKIDSFNNEDYAKGLVNDAYTRALPGSEDWNPLVKEGFVATAAYYTTGTVSCSLGSTAVTGVGTTWTAGMLYTAGYRVKFTGSDVIYEFTRTGNTTATINPALAGDAALSGATYTVFKDEFSLPSDFDRFLKNGSFYVYRDGRYSDTLIESPRDQFREEFVPEPSDPPYRCMLTRTDTNGYRMVRLNPPPKSARNYPIDYVPKVPPMKEYTTGTVALVAGDATVTGTGTSWTANVSVGDYFRVDTNGQGDSSKWYKVATVTDNTHIELDAVWGESAETGVEYTICSAPTAFPPEFHEFILYEGVAVATSSNTDPNSQIMLAKRGEILARLKKNYKSRRSNSQFGVDDDGYR
jgi:hypothetical protein